ncbi:MAG: hypothetical protein ACR2HJ_04825 [Fimbriimonadales bacterium]
MTPALTEMPPITREVGTQSGPTTAYLSNPTDAYGFSLLMDKFERFLKDAEGDARDDADPIPSERAIAFARKTAGFVIANAVRVASAHRHKPPSIGATFTRRGEVEVTVQLFPEDLSLYYWVSADGNTVRAVTVDRDLKSEKVLG